MSSLIGRKTLVTVACVVLALAPTAARGVFVEVDSFDLLSLGEIDGQSDWNATRGSGSVVVDPLDAANQVLEIAPMPGVLSRDAHVNQGTVRMLFLRFRFENQQNLSFGMSHLSSPKEFSDFGPELRKSDATHDLKIHDGSTYEDLTTLEPATWYNLWALVDNLTDETMVWLHSRPGERAFPSDLLDAEQQTAFGFRTAGSSNLVNFYIKSSAGGGRSGPLWIDDIQLENTSALNLANPLVQASLGDLNGDGLVDIADVDLLSAAIASHSADLLFDLDASRIVDAGDLHMMIGDVLNTWLGDADLDGQFSSTDLVRVFQGGKYELDVDAGWSDGDWNADLRFESGDLVAAMQQGGYEQGVRPALQAVPEPTGIALALLACAGLWAVHRAARCPFSGRARA